METMTIFITANPPMNVSTSIQSFCGAVLLNKKKIWSTVISIWNEYEDAALG